MGNTPRNKKATSPPTFTVTATATPEPNECLLVLRGTGLVPGTGVTVDYLSLSGSMIADAPTGIAVARDGTLNATKSELNNGLVQTFKVLASSGERLSVEIATTTAPPPPPPPPPPSSPPTFTVTATAASEPNECLLEFRGAGLAPASGVTVDYLSLSGSMITNAPTGIAVASDGTLNATKSELNSGLVQTFKVLTPSGEHLSAEITTSAPADGLAVEPGTEPAPIPSPGLPPPEA